MLSELDRRTIGNLSIPRNVVDLSHVLRVDPHTETRPETEVVAHLESLEDSGLVVNLGEVGDPAKVPGVAERHTHALTMPDDQGATYASRLAHPRFYWRTTGNLYVVTDDGVHEMRAPVSDSPPMTPTEVQAAIDHEWSRVLKGVTVANFRSEFHGPELSAGRMLEDNFQHWVGPVIDECERMWNVRPENPNLRPIMAGGAGWTDEYEILLLNAENQKTALGAVVDPWFMALSIFAYTDTDTGATHGDATRVPTYTGYAAIGVPASSMTTASAGSSNNSTAITFAACTAGSSAIIGFGNNSVVGNTSGVFRKYGACSSTTVSTTQTPATFAISAYTTTAD